MRWVSLKTDDRGLANRLLKEELSKPSQTHVRHENLKLAALLEMYNQRLNRFDAGTQENRRAIIKVFEKTWKHGLDGEVRDVTSAQLEVWLAQRPRG